MKNYFNYKWIIPGAVVVYLGVLVLSHIINKQMDTALQTSPPVQATKLTDTVKKKVLVPTTTEEGIPLRTESKNPKHDFTESIILVEGEEVARFKTEDEKIFDAEGQIPDGKIKFVNTWKSIYGFEHFREGKREGPYVAYYQNGQIQSEAKYAEGQVLKRKTYYYSGELQMEENYANAQRAVIFLRDKLKHVGRGKMYRLDGSLKEEWHVTDDTDQNYIRRYNSKGDVAKESFYTKEGELIQK